MANGLVVIDGHVAVLEMLIASGLELRLFTNNRTPKPGDGLRLYTEPTDEGYRAITLDRAAWVIVPGQPARAQHFEVEFKFRVGGFTIYGHTLSIKGRLYGVQQLEFPFEVRYLGDALAVQPTLLQGSKPQEG